MTNDFLKIILTIVILLCVVGVFFWFISDKYPGYAAKKEVRTALTDIANGYKKFATNAGEPVTMELMYKNNWVTLDKETKKHWTFEMYGDPPNTIIAQSTPAMHYGRDKMVKIDIETMEMTGWSFTGAEDTTIFQAPVKRN